MTMAPANHLSTLKEAEMDLAFVHACLGSMTDTWTDAAKPGVDEVGIIIVDVNALLQLLIGGGKVVPWRLLFTYLCENAENWRH